MAMSLPVFFAACTSEEFETQNVDVNGNQRPVVGDVRVVLGDAMSRVANPETGTFAFTENMGAVLMDTPTNTGTTFAEKYALSNTVATDYPFVLSDDAWSTTGLLLEGNYFFYYPAKEEGMTRQKFTYEIAEDQKAYDAEGNFKRYQPVTDNQLYVSYKGFEANTKMEGEVVEIVLPQAHAQMNFNVVYNGNHQIAINKIVLEPATKKFITKGYLDVEHAASTDEYAIAGVDTLDNGGNLPALYNVYNQATGSIITNAKYNPLNITSAFKSVDSSKDASSISVSLKNTKLSKGESVAVSMIVPSTVDNSFTAKIYTDKGIVTYDAVGSKAYTEGAGATLDTVAVSRLYQNGAWLANDNANAQLDSIVAQATRALELSFKDQAIEVDDNFTVKSTEELAMFLGYHEFQAYTNDHAITAKLAADGIELSQESYTILKNNPKIKLTVNADAAKYLTIGSDVTATDALYKFAWGANVLPCVEAGATQVINAAVEFNRIINYGTLTIANYDEEGEAVATSIANNIFNVGKLVVNTPVNGPIVNGTVETDPALREYDNVVSTASAEVNANLTASPALINFATATITADEITAIYNNKVTKGTGASALVKAGSISVNDSLVVSSINNDGALALNETVEITSLTNTKDLTVAAGKTLFVRGTSTTSGTLTNNGYVKVSGNLENTGTLTNNYALTNQGAGTMSNTNKVIVNNGAIYTYLTNNAGGEIVIYNRDEEVKVGNGTTNQGTITYTAVEGDYTSAAFTSKAGDKFNKLIVEKAGADLTNVNKNVASVLVPGTDYTQVLALVLNVNTTSNFKFNTSGATFDALTVGKADNTSICTISVNAKNLTVNNSLTVCPKTEFHITSGNTVNYVGTAAIVNNGSILVGGTFNALKLYAPTEGTEEANKYETTGVGGSINWKE